MNKLTQKAIDDTVNKYRTKYRPPHTVPADDTVRGPAINYVMGEISIMKQYAKKYGYNVTELKD